MADVRKERATAFNKAHRKEIRDGFISQRNACLMYLKEYGSITPLEALYAFGCFRLSAIIYNLRHRDGYVISMTINDDGKPYAIYTLIEDGEDYEG